MAVAESVVAQVLALVGLAGHAAHRVFRSVLRLNLRHERVQRFVARGFDAVSDNVFLRRFEGHAAGDAQHVFVVVLLFDIAREAVHLPYHDDIECALLRILYHLQELRPVIASPRHGIVAVLSHDLVAVLLGIDIACVQLVFDGCVTLFVTTEARIESASD
nr:hypothetical protein [Parvibacter caecicola]